MLNASLSLPGARLAPVSLVMRPVIRPFCTRHWGVCDWVCTYVWLRVCVSAQWICVCVCVCSSLSVWGYVLYVRNRKRSSMRDIGLLECECTMFPVNMLLPNKRAPVLCARAGAPQRAGCNVVQFCSGTIQQEFSSTDTTVGRIPIQSICADIPAAGEECAVQWDGKTPYRMYLYALNSYNDVCTKMWYSLNVTLHLCHTLKPQRLKLCSGKILEHLVGKVP